MMVHFMAVPTAEARHNGLHPDAQRVDIGSPVQISQQFFIDRHIALVNFAVATRPEYRAPIADKVFGGRNHFLFGQKITQCRVDMIMVPYEWKKFMANTIQQVKRGEIAQARLDDAVRRILRVKFRSGLMSGKAPSERLLAGRDALVGFAPHRKVARAAVRKSLTLLKNNGVLPLTAGRIHIAGPGADNVRMQSGGWTMDWQGRDVPAKKYSGYTTIGAGLREAIAETNAGLVDSAEALQAGDVAVYVFGETPYAEFEGDKDSTDYDKLSSKDLEFFASMQAKGVKTVAVFLTGRPSGIDRVIDAADAFVVAWLPGSEGGGVADVLVANDEGKPSHDFTGRLPFAWPADGGTATKPAAVRFQRGFGLSY